ncbi:hypothetical protein Achl_4349 (plasmid) [Pseudarthrobacter chlorophenolicus A6]|uniref:Uncharacterized protein n=1 Tax=Pseudarthrobacter chlorophenolicus (strain ATCC 700700 / DSM 12829 / CIP 107037 / JCM 12360 / KCTC 9906 / NCIMB 13794 / A6) TaxID=452863 RepID=B8HIQ3_PSECP|nr:hypothetical protein [Pseudarthrobacter chlorophenolicus]ACL42300.1 hypothetical protein Achl_4349 [Pseudarthrobacter chlorophenolicus A6]SDQ16193.1 hypothetical protein SAMN04489738_0406 [Pseudarthrobacter chlorophenolicus]
MTLPHPDKSQPSPWKNWPEHLPQPAAVHSIEKVDDETRNAYKITMPNGATCALWWVINSWDGDYELDRSPGDWTPYGLAFDEEAGLLDGPGSDCVYEAVEEWARQERGRPCPTCRCSGRVLGVNTSKGLAYLLSPKYEWETCPTCLGMSLIPHPPA